MCVIFYFHAGYSWPPDVFFWINKIYLLQYCTDNIWVIRLGCCTFGLFIHSKEWTFTLFIMLMLLMLCAQSF